MSQQPPPPPPPPPPPQPPTGPPPPSTESEPEAESGFDVKKPWWKRWWGITIIVVVVMSVIGGLLGDDVEDTSDSTSAADVEETPESALEGDAEIEAEVETPDFVGLSFDEATEAADAVGLDLKPVDEDGQSVAIVLSGNWEIESQDPSPATVVGVGEEVTVKVFRPADREREAEREAQAQADAERAAEEERLREEALAELQDPDFYQSLDSREFALLVKDPDSFAGEAFVLYGEVAQFDSATGTDTFRANASYKMEDTWWLDGENVVVTGDANMLREVVADDVVKMHVIAYGSLTYETQIGGATSVPAFEVFIIEVLG